MADIETVPDWFRGIKDQQCGSPALVLVAWTDDKGRYVAKSDAETLLPGSDWHRLRHQCAGVCCLQFAFWACQVATDAYTLEGLKKAESRWFGTDLGRGEPTWWEWQEYDSSLRNLFGDQVHCRDQKAPFVEGLYPIDLTPAALNRLAIDGTSKFLHSKISEILPDVYVNHQGLKPYLRLFILGANSD